MDEPRFKFDHVHQDVNQEEKTAVISFNLSGGMFDRFFRMVNISHTGTVQGLFENFLFNYEDDSYNDCSS